jgi:hypothetical protein
MSMAELASAAPTSGGVRCDRRAGFPLIDFCTYAVVFLDALFLLPKMA